MLIVPVSVVVGSGTVVEVVWGKAVEVDSVVVEAAVAVLVLVVAISVVVGSGTAVEVVWGKAVEVDSVVVEAAAAVLVLVVAISGRCRLWNCGRCCLGQSC